MHDYQYEPACKTLPPNHTLDECLRRDVELMSDRRDAKLIARSGEGACATTRSTIAAKLDLAECSPVVLSKADANLIRSALRRMVMSKGSSQRERAHAKELLERKFSEA
jgi:hypothetical protein